MSVWLTAVLFVATFAVSLATVHGIRRLAPALHLVDVPNERSLHRDPTPRGGGVGILLACMIATVCVAGLGLRPPVPIAAVYCLGAGMIVVTSLIDDIRSLPVRIRLPAQVVAASVVTSQMSFVSASNLGFGTLESSMLFGLTLIWIVGLTNAYNFMDGVDGMAGLQGILLGFAFAILAAKNGDAWYSAFALLIAAGCLGFLLLNWSPARIFMGDVGSAFLGFTFAVLALVVPHSRAQLVSGLFIAWPIVFDVGFTLARRIRLKEDILTAHRSHLYQRLVMSGLPPSRVVLIYAALTLVSIADAIFFWDRHYRPIWVLAQVVLVVESFGLWRFVVYREHKSRKIGVPRIVS